MQKSIKEDFDLQVRSIMEEAQEPAPAGAWDAISSRLDALMPATAASAGAATSAGKPFHRAWYWAGATLAAAAAVALGIFLVGTKDNNSNLINNNSDKALIAEVAEPAAPVADIAQPIVSQPVAPENVQSAAATKPVAAASRPVATASKPAVSLPGSENTAETGTNTENSAIRSENTAKTGTGSEKAAASQPASTPSQPAVDPFAQMAYEDARNAENNRRVASILVKGGASTNNAGAAKVSWGAPGNYQQSGVTETSKSSFGVPVIVGIGARLPLNETLSIGTGIDYSLLTRTFEGIYNEGLTIKTGDFNHTLQYIGIPVDLFVKLVNKNDITLYSTVGAEAEIPIYNKYHLLGTDITVGDKINGLQWSVGAGLGLEFNVSKSFGIFAEPSVKYYFDCDQPKSIRTDKPFQMVLRAGVRFDI